MLIALMLAVATALLIAFGVGASHRPRPSHRSSTRDRRDDVEELVVLDIVSDGELDGDLDGDLERPDER